MRITPIIPSSFYSPKSWQRQHCRVKSCMTARNIAVHFCNLMCSNWTIYFYHTKHCRGSGLYQTDSWGTGQTLSLPTFSLYFFLPTQVRYRHVRLIDRSLTELMHHRPRATLHTLESLHIRTTLQGLIDWRYGQHALGIPFSCLRK